MDPFLQSLVIEETSVLGRKLLPLSAWHVCALMFLDSPFVIASKITTESIVVAAHVLTTKWATGIDQLLHPDTDAIVEWGCKNKECDWINSSRLIEQHIEKYLSNLPEIWRSKETKNVPSAVPWPYLCVVTMMQNLKGLTEEQIWDMPINRLLCYRACIAENNGHELVTQKQKEAVKFLKEQAAKGGLEDG